MSTTKPKVAIIGLGNIGSTVAFNLVKGGRPVIIADRKTEKLSALAAELGSLASPMPIPDAIKSAELIIFSVWFGAIKELLHAYGPELEGKIIIDPSNPIVPDEKGGFKKIVGADQSAGRINSTYLPANSKLVKAFGTLGVASLKNAAFQKPERAVLFYAMDDIHFKAVVEGLIKDSGFDPVPVGDLEQSIRIEVFGDLHEFGALGKTITINQFKELSTQPANV